MIITKLADADRYAGLLAGLAEAFAYLRETDLHSLAPGRYEVDGERIFALVAETPGKPREEGQLEVHRRYLDVQYLLSGEEWFGWRSAGECVTPAGEFDAEKDLGFFAEAPTAYYPLAPETCAIFFPEDTHAPGLGEGLMRKVVVKVRL